MTRRAAQTILHDRQIAYAITDRRLNIIEVSGASSSLQAWLRNWMGRPLTEVMPELVGNEDALADVLTGELPRFQLSYINRDLPDGKTAYLDIIDLPYTDDAGSIIGLIHVIQDVTEVGKLEQRLTQQRNELHLLGDALHQKNLALEAANAELQRMDQLKSVFVSIAAHELRTPLASIGGYVEMLLDGDAGPLTARQREYLHIIQDSAHRLVQITRDLSDLTRLEIGRLEVTLLPTDLVELVERVAAEHMPQLDAQAQQLTLRAPTDLPVVLCDPARAGQVIGNLLSNASKYSPIGSAIVLEIKRTPEGDFLEVAVTDEGIGIADEDQEKIFDLFFRARNAGKTSGGGIGLGLYIARALAELQGGRLWFESVLGQGSVFHVTFPVAGRA